MFYQTIKYYVVRTGLTFFLSLTLGYLALFFAHEVALPTAHFNDLWIKAVVGVICLFFGFVVYGMFGEHRFIRALEGLRHIDLKNAGPAVRKSFQGLVDFTESSYFLPGKGHRLREQLVQDYAEFLLSTGAEDPEALNVFLKAFLRDPEQTRFRNVLVSSLSRSRELTDQEVDLILVIMKTEEYRDHELLKHLVEVFLDKEVFSNKSEPVFLKALQLKTGQENKIITFMLPHLLEKKRTDYLAVNFYLESLASIPEDQRGALTFLVGSSFCEDRFKVLDPGLHERCQQVFDTLDTQSKERLSNLAVDGRVADRWKKVKLFHSEDKRALERLKVYTGLSPTFWQVVGKKIAGLGSGLFRLIKKATFGVFDGMNILGNLGTAAKLALVGVVGAGVFYAAVAVDWKALFQEPPPAPVAPTKPVKVPQIKVHTIQVAAVKSKAKADKAVRILKKKKVADVYVVKTQRKDGGFWYKVRVGKLKDRTEAEKLAASLQDQKAIRSYFIISLMVDRPESK